MIKKRNYQESMICLTPKPSWKVLFVYRIQNQENILQKRGSEGLNKKWKEGILTPLD